MEAKWSEKVQILGFQWGLCLDYVLGLFKQDYSGVNTIVPRQQSQQNLELHGGDSVTSLIFLKRLLT